MLAREYDHFDVNIADAERRTALILAAAGGHTKVVRWLINRGADVDAADAEGRTALIHAADRGDVKMMQLLLDAAPSFTN